LFYSTNLHESQRIHYYQMLQCSDEYETFGVISNKVRALQILFDFSVVALGLVSIIPAVYTAIIECYKSFGY